MKKLIGILFLSTLTFAVHAQNIIGDWKGVLKIGETELPLILHIAEKDNGLSATFDSPAQGAKNIPLTEMSMDENKIVFSKQEMKMSYEGELKNDEIVGSFKQGGLDLPLVFNRLKKDEPASKPKPQEPKLPYPYFSEDVLFTNKKENMKLAGTLTLPKKEGLFPVVILISGSGPQNRNEELLGHKPFLVLSDYLTRNGYAVLRYDDRGVAKSEGDFSKATSADLAADVSAAIEYCQSRKEINKVKIGLLGHSEGGMIAPMVAATNKNVAFVIMMAGPGIPINELMLLQVAGVMRTMDATDTEIAEQLVMNKNMYDIILNNTDDNIAKKKLGDYFDAKSDKQNEEGLIKNADQEKMKQQQIAALTSPWMLYFLRYNPTANLQKLTCPVLALNGEKDIQVTPKENLAGIKKALQKNKQATVQEIKGVNHLFQNADTGAISEYAEIEQTMSPIVLKTIVDWLQKNNI